MQAKVGCEYISDLSSYKRKVWQEMKRLNPAAADGAFVLQAVCSGFQYQNSFCPGFILQVGPDLAA